MVTFYKNGTSLTLKLTSVGTVLECHLDMLKSVTTVDTTLSQVICENTSFGHIPCHSHCQFLRELVTLIKDATLSEMFCLLSTVKKEFATREADFFFLGKTPF